MTRRKPGTKFSVARELRRSFNWFPHVNIGTQMSTEDYVKMFCKGNSHIPSKYVINGKEVTA